MNINRYYFVLHIILPKEKAYCDILISISNRLSATGKFDISSGLQDIPTEGIQIWCEENGNKLYENIHFLLPKKNAEEKIRKATEVRI